MADKPGIYIHLWRNTQGPGWFSTVYLDGREVAQGNHDTYELAAAGAGKAAQAAEKGTDR